MEKMIICPAHPNENHVAFLYLNGSRYPGVWECSVTGESESCQHPDTHLEDTCLDMLGFDGHYQFDSQVCVCDNCEVAVI